MTFLAGIKGRLLALAIVALFLIPITMYGLNQADKPEVYPGDQLEMRQCQKCSGAGCEVCDDRGKVYVIRPGNQHPSWVRIEVSQDKAPASASAPDDRDLLKPVPGAVGGTVIRFERDGKAVEVTSTFTGRTKVRLAPGKWNYTAQRKGYLDATGTLDVPVLTDEIWTTSIKVGRNEGMRLRIEMHSA